jgi:hypothetical protein
MTIIYEPSELRVSFFWKWRGTIFPLVLADPLFWFLIGNHCVLLVVQNTLVQQGSDGLPMLHDPMLWDACAVLLGMVTFLLVFFADHCYKRFLELHHHSIAICRAVYEWSQLVQLHFAHKSAAQRWNMMRKVLGAMQYHYAFVRREGNEFGVSQLEWNAMVKEQLFTRKETRALSDRGGFASLLATTWALNEIKLAVLADSSPAGAKKPTPHTGRVTPLTTMPQLTIFHKFGDVARTVLTDGLDLCLSRRLMS